MPEGTIAFPNEPLLRVTAPFREALLIESGLLQAINLATLIATKAARIVWAAQGRRVAEFALRRAQDPFVVARSSYIGGCSSTSFLAAAFRYRLLATGTIPHALVQLFATEEEAFAAVAETFNRYTLLLDTYDARRAIHTADRRGPARAGTSGPHAGRRPARQRRSRGRQPLRARAVLDEAGMGEVRILASGDLDEFEIAELLDGRRRSTPSASAPSLGVGARLASSTASRAARSAASTKRSGTRTRRRGAAQAQAGGQQEHLARPQGSLSPSQLGSRT